MLIPRHMTPHLREAAGWFPVVTVTGPRQSGKTTLVRMAFPGYHYCNLEDPEVRALAVNDARAFFVQNPCPLIIDEIQRVPQLLSHIQVITDERGEKGAFILTGSNQGQLQQGISQSLAGRTAIMQLLPLSLAELANHGVSAPRDRHIIQGFMPRIFKDGVPPQMLYRNYLQTYVERDVRQLLNVRDLMQFDAFVRLLAGRVACVLNLSSLAGDLGVSGTTLKHWLSVLEASFLVFRLPPFLGNPGKRVIRSPKLYFTEPGLAAYLLGLRTPRQVSQHPLCGNLFENMVVVEAMKAAHNRGEEPNLYFYRDRSGREIDLVQERGRDLVPVEIKAAMTFNSSLLDNLRYFQKTIPRAVKGALVYAGDFTPDLPEARVVNFVNTCSVFFEE